MSSLVIERKVKGGKLFRLRVITSDESFIIRLTGDFFLEPDEGLDIIERNLVDCFALSDKEEAKQKLTETISRANIRISGFDIVDIIDALWEAKR